MTLTASPSLSSLRGRLNALFILNGLLFASWAVQIPAVQGRSHLSITQLSGLLFALTAGTLLSRLLTQQVLATRGARQAGVMNLLLMTIPLALLSVVSFMPAAVVLAFLFGMGFGGMDFTLNGVGGWLEDRMQRPIMSGLHGSYSLGALVGAGIGALLLSRHVTMNTHLIGAGAVGLLAGLLALAQFPAHVEQASRSRVRRPQLAMLLLLIPGFFAAYGEGTVTDWSAVYLKGVFTANHAQASLGFVAFSALMVLGRFTGDRLTGLFGAARLALWATLAAAAGFALVTWTGSVTGTVLGFTLAGAGLSVLAPLTFSAAWRLQGSAGIALLATVFTSGFLAGPPLTGIVIQHAQLTQAFTLPILLAAVSLLAMLARPLYSPAVTVPQQVPQV
jgi:predicted MFS family arabinose efflux permease